MQSTARVFVSGNSQAIRLPKAFRVDASEVWISRDDQTGEITLKPIPDRQTVNAFIAELRAMPPSDEFLMPRDDSPAPDPLADWQAPPG